MGVMLIEVNKQLSVTVEPTRILVKSAFHPDLPSQFRRLHGDFDRGQKTWVFPRNAEVEEWLGEMYGLDFNGQNPTTVVQVDDRFLAVPSSVASVGGYLLCMRREPYRKVELGKGVKKIAGGFADDDPRCGYLCAMPGTILELTVTQRFAETMNLDSFIDPNKVGLSSYSDEDLMAEVERRGLLSAVTIAPSFSEEEDDGLPF